MVIQEYEGRSYCWMNRNRNGLHKPNVNYIELWWGKRKIGIQSFGNRFWGESSEWTEFFKSILNKEGELIWYLLMTEFCHSHAPELKWNLTTGDTQLIIHNLCNHKQWGILPEACKIWLLKVYEKQWDFGSSKQPSKLLFCCYSAFFHAIPQWNRPLRKTDIFGNLTVFLVEDSGWDEDEDFGMRKVSDNVLNFRIL